MLKITMIMIKLYGIRRIFFVHRCKKFFLLLPQVHSKSVHSLCIEPSLLLSYTTFVFWHRYCILSTCIFWNHYCTSGRIDKSWGLRMYESNDHDHYSKESLRGCMGLKHEPFDLKYHLFRNHSRPKSFLGYRPHSHCRMEKWLRRVNDSANW